MAYEQNFTDAMQTLKEAVKKAIMQAKISRVNYWFFLEYAIDGLRYINMHVSNDGKEWRKVVPDSTNRIDFPPDMEGFIGIYESIAGELWPLTRNDNIVPTTTLVAAVDTLDATKQEGVDIPIPIGSIANTRGGVNTRGSYTIDWINSKIIFNNVTATELVLVFKTSGTMFSARTYVYNKYIPFLIAFMMNENAKYDDRLPASRRDELERQLHTQRLELGRIESPNLDEFMDTIRSTYYGTAKRS